MALDLWIINHFQVLPTDERYEKLTEAQKELLYVGYLNLPTSEQLHAHFNKTKGEQVPSISDDDARNFEKILGYSKQQVQKMRDEVKKVFGDG